MIKIQKITIHEFRGIKDLTLELKGQNFAACGPNGTGKSGIVDAIEFALTGNVSRLSGRGTGGLSVKQHGPHVDSRNKPEAAWVTLEVSIPALADKKASIYRNVKTPAAPKIEPADADVFAALNDVKLHPEFVLSRRELIRYVISEPGDRSKEVQALLRLDEVEKLRVVLQKISNSYSKELPPLERAEKDAFTALTSALGVSQLAKSEILTAVNQKRQILGLPALSDLAPSVSLSDGLASGSAASIQQVPKVQATADAKLLMVALDKISSEETVKKCAALHAIASELAADTTAAEGVKRETMLAHALELYDGELCPVCDKPFEMDEFRAHLATKLGHLNAITAKRRALEQGIAELLNLISAAGSMFNTVIAYGALFDPPVDVTKLTNLRINLRAQYAQLHKLFPLDETAGVLLAVHKFSDLSEALAPIEFAINGLPEPSAQDAARDYLTISQERLVNYRVVRQNHNAGKSRAARAEKIFKVFADTTTKSLEGIYDAVQEWFATYYRAINKDDEAAFTAKLIPSLGKLGFDVDFYGRGHFPPGAYHSEGHQDGMGLCLYLALMNHLLGNKFTFAVLDDVLMSVDKGHRREVCSLLKEFFPDTQFIFTTHDEVWLRHMKSEGVVKDKNFVNFKTWSVDTGPIAWSSKSVWDEINVHLEKNEVSPASAVLRRHLEFFFGESCHRLRAGVEYRGDGQFALGDLMSGGISAMGKALKQAKAAANSWGQIDMVSTLEAREIAFNDKKKLTNVDQWQVNAAVHYNPWADLDQADFVPVVMAFKELTCAFTCQTCDEMYYILPDRGIKETLRCGCGQTNFNLKSK